MAKPADPGDRYTWNKGDLVLLKPGKGGPLLSEAELNRILRQNEDQLQDQGQDQGQDQAAPAKPAAAAISRPGRYKV